MQYTRDELIGMISSSVLAQPERYVALFKLYGRPVSDHPTLGEINALVGDNLDKSDIQVPLAQLIADDGYSNIVPVIVAAIISSAVSGGVSIFGTLKGSSAAQKQLDTQRALAKMGLLQERELAQMQIESTANIQRQQIYANTVAGYKAAQQDAFQRNQVIFVIGAGVIAVTILGFLIFKK